MGDKVHVRIRQASWSELSTSTQDRLLDLTLYKTGCMRHFVIEKSPQVFIAYVHGAGFKGQRIGWACYDIETGWTMFYIHHTCRRRGVADQLMQAVLAYVGSNCLLPPKISDWSTSTYYFFKRYAGKIRWGDYGEIEKFNQRYHKWRKR